MSRAIRPNYIPTLDGWRAIAICLVIGSHIITVAIATQTLWGKAAAAAFGHNHLGVDIFFALSGYLICTLLLNERANNNRIDLRRFYTRRAFRILPPMLVYLAVLGLLSVFAIIPRIATTDFLAVIGFVRNYFGFSLYTGHFWSLAVEEQFYLFVPLLLSRLNWRAALGATLLIALSSGVIRALEYSAVTDPGNLRFRTECRLDALMYGAALALLLQQRSVRTWFIRKLSTVAILLWAVLTLAALMPLPFSARRSVIALALPMFVVYTVLHPNRVLGRFLELTPVRWVGRLSYSLYIWQEIFLVHEGQPLGILQSYPVNLLMAVACAVVSHYAVELPMIRLGHRLAAVRNSRARVTLVAPETPSLQPLSE